MLHVRRVDRGRELAEIGVLERDGEYARVVGAWRSASGWQRGRERLFELIQSRGVSVP